MCPEALPLAGQVALVTGSSQGIGLALARRIGQLGAAVSLCARQAPRLEASRRALAAEGIAALATPTDVRQADQVKRLVEATRQEFGEIDIVVNNAGVGWFGAIQEATEGDWDRVIDTNLKAPFLLMRTVAPFMIARGRGHFIQIASLAGKSAFAGGGIYCASKWGLLGLTYAVAEDLRAHGIRTSVVCPGSVLTEFSPHAGRDPRKLLQPDDVAHAVEMILREQRQSFISEVLVRPTEKP